MLPVYLAAAALVLFVAGVLPGSPRFDPERGGWGERGDLRGGRIIKKKKKKKRTEGCARCLVMDRCRLHVSMEGPDYSLRSRSACGLDTTLPTHSIRLPR